MEIFLVNVIEIILTVLLKNRGRATFSKCFNFISFPNLVSGVLKFSFFPKSALRVRSSKSWTFPQFGTSFICKAALLVFA